MSLDHSEPAIDADSITAKTGARVLRLKVKSIRDPDHPAEMRDIPVDDLQVKVVSLPETLALSDIAVYAKRSTGEKFLINPNKAS